MTAHLQGRHALVTGGGSGVGEAVALALAKAGAEVTVCGRRAEPLHALAKRYSNIHAFQADVTDLAAMQQLYQQAVAARGSVDVVIANAGAADSVPAHRMSAEQWRQSMAVNLDGAFYTVAPALEYLRQCDWGRVVFIASTAALKGYGYVAHYVAAKHGVLGLTRALAEEYASTGTTFNAVCPGFTDTPLLRRSIANIMQTTGRSEQQALDELCKSNPQKRLVTAEEVAQTVLWLCGPHSQSMNGQAIAVAGGEV